MITWIECLATWDGSLPAVLIGTDLTLAERRALPQRLAAAALGLDAESVVVERMDGRAPRVEQPAGSGLCLSVAARAPFAAAAIAASPVGIDVEIVDGRGEVPWNVLHPSEAAFLAGLTGEDRARAFARLWSLKEAYLKARRTGLSREPSSFAVRFTGEETAAVQDPLTPDARMLARTLWREAGEVCGVFSVIVAAP